MSKLHDLRRVKPLLGTGLRHCKVRAGTPARVKAPEAVCLLCAEPLADGRWCDRCHVSHETVARIFQEQRLEEAGSPCAPLVFLALIATLTAAVGVVLWSALGR